MAGPSMPATGSKASATGSDVLVKLQGLLSLSASEALERKALDSVGECLNDLAADGYLSGAAVTRASSTLERTREYFGIFEIALRAEDELQAALVAQEALRPQVEALRVKKEELADLDRQIAELQSQRSTVASELAKAYESGGKSCLTDYAANPA